MSWTDLERLMTDRPTPSGRRALLHEELRRHTLALLDRRWQQLWGSFGLSVILVGFGVRLISGDTPRLGTGLALTLGGGLCWLLHRSVQDTWRRIVQHRHDWLGRVDQGLVAGSFWLAIFAPAESWWWPVPMLSGMAWGVLKLMRNAQQHWASWFFRLARQTLRQHPIR
jgi:hypothetical protein